MLRKSLLLYNYSRLPCLESVVVYNVRPICVDMRIGRYRLTSPRVILCQRFVVERFRDLFRSHVLADKNKIAQISMMSDVRYFH